MVRVLSGWALVASLFLSAGCGKKDFTEFSSAEGKFKALFPGTPKETSQNAAGMNMKIFTVEERNGAYVVAFADLPLAENMPDAEIQTRLDGAKQGMVNNVNGKLTGESQVKLDGQYPGREVKADLPDKKGQLQARVYLVGKRLYQIMVVGTSSTVGSADTVKFLDSLKVTK
jgi:hypothetical protein